jgi:hypothetical protein
MGVFADLAPRLVSCELSEADPERVLWIQKNITSLHGTGFGLRAIEVQLRNARDLSTRNLIKKRSP